MKIDNKTRAKIDYFHEIAIYEVDRHGHFLHYLLHAYIRADTENAALMLDLMEKMTAKYRLRAAPWTLNKQSTS